MFKVYCNKTRGKRAYLLLLNSFLTYKFAAPFSTFPYRGGAVSHHRWEGIRSCEYEIAIERYYCKRYGEKNNV